MKGHRAFFLALAAVSASALHAAPMAARRVPAPGRIAPLAVAGARSATPLRAPAAPMTRSLAAPSLSPGSPASLALPQSALTPDAASRPLWGASAAPLQAQGAASPALTRDLSGREPAARSDLAPAAASLGARLEGTRRWLSETDARKDPLGASVRLASLYGEASAARSEPLAVSAASPVSFGLLRAPGRASDGAGAPQGFRAEPPSGPGERKGLLQGLRAAGGRVLKVLSGAVQLAFGGYFGFQGGEMLYGFLLHRLGLIGLAVLSGLLLAAAVWNRRSLDKNKFRFFVPAFLGGLAFASLAELLWDFLGSTLFGAGVSVFGALAAAIVLALFAGGKFGKKK